MMTTELLQSNEWVIYIFCIIKIGWDWYLKKEFGSTVNILYVLVNNPCKVFNSWVKRKINDNPTNSTMISKIDFLGHNSFWSHSYMFILRVTINHITSYLSYYEFLPILTLYWSIYKILVQNVYLILLTLYLLFLLCSLFWNSFNEQYQQQYNQSYLHDLYKPKQD